MAQIRYTVDLDPRVPDSHYYLGIFLAASGEHYYHKALHELEIALDNPNFALRNRYQAIITYTYLMRYFHLQVDEPDYEQAKSRLKALAKIIDEWAKIVEISK